jgi:uncharacterized membrane protein
VSEKQKSQVVQKAPAQGGPGGGLGANVRAVSLEYSGPLPPANEIQKYEAACPGLADRIVKMAEAEQAHRHRMDERVVRHQARRSWGGLITGSVIALAFLVGAVYLIARGSGVEGTILGTVDLVALVTVFVLGRRPSPDEAEGD